MRAYSPGGRFDADFETNAIQDGAIADLQNPAGTTADWYIFDPVNSVEDPVYDVGAAIGGRRWLGPFALPITRAVIQQGEIDMSERGFYAGNLLHLTLDYEQVNAIMPNVVGNPHLEGRGRIIWLGQVWRPHLVQQRGIVKDRYSFLVVDCIQVKAEEMVNDPQFQQYANLVDAPGEIRNLPQPIPLPSPGTSQVVEVVEFDGGGA